jgi:hypothetical protein
MEPQGIRRWICDFFIGKALDPTAQSRHANPWADFTFADSANAIVHPENDPSADQRTCDSCGQKRKCVWIIHCSHACR